MNAVKRMLAVVAVVAAVAALVLWAIAYSAVRTIEDGTLVSNLASDALDNPAVEAFIVEKAQAAVDDSLTEQGVDLRRLGLDGAVDQLVATVVKSQAVEDAIASAVESAHADLAAQLAAPERPEAPLTLTIDLSVVINDGIGDAPLIGAVLPEVNIAPVEVEVIDAAKFERVRGVYSWVDLVATWAGWLGLALLALAVVLTPNKRWFLPKLLFWLGGLSLVAWVVANAIDVERLADMAPGGREGGLGTAIAELVSQESLDSATTRILVAAVGLLAVAAILSLVVRAMSRPRKKPKHGPDGPRHA